MALSNYRPCRPRIVSHSEVSLLLFLSNTVGESRIFTDEQYSARHSARMFPKAE